MTKFKGVFTALITPFLDGKVDFASFENLIAQQLKGGVDGFVINGTTAESPTLTRDERLELFRTAQRQVPRGFTLIMGTGSNSTEESILASREAEKIGADACLTVVPYYNKPPQRGLLEHFKAIASSVQIPIILYNVPSRTVTSLELETVRKLSEHPNIIGIKEASGQIDFAKQIRESCGKQFILLSGDDISYDQFMKSGGDGVISVASHLIPQPMKDQKASQFIDLIEGLFIESNPIPLKMALFLMKVIKSPEVRLPLVTLGSEKTAELKDLLVRSGLLK